MKRKRIGIYNVKIIKLVTSNIHFIQVQNSKNLKIILERRFESFGRAISFYNELKSRSDVMKQSKK